MNIASSGCEAGCSTNQYLWNCSLSAFTLLSPQSAPDATCPIRYGITGRSSIDGLHAMMSIPLSLTLGGDAFRGFLHGLPSPTNVYTRRGAFGNSAPSGLGTPNATAGPWTYPPAATVEQA